MTETVGAATPSLSRHIVRGLIGFGGIIGSVALIPVLGLAALVLLPIGMVALRGCPTCWAMSLVETISAGRLKRSCADGRCELHSQQQDAS